MKRISLVLLSILFLSLSLFAQNPRLVFGRPEKISLPETEAMVLAATASPTNEVAANIPATKANKTNQNDLLVTRRSFVLSYNRSRGAANWVNWHLQKSDIGKIRRDRFHPDPLLPPALRIPGNAYDFKHTLMQRGHMCPSKDRSTTLAKNDETFVMSNMQPQVQELNEVTWGNLEDDTRKIVLQKHEAYIIAGCYGGSKTIFNGKIVIPTKCYKIVVILPMGVNDLSRVTEDTQIIAVIMPNDHGINPDWRRFITTVDKIEDETGFDFLTTLPNDIEDAVEAKKFKP